MWEWSEMIKDLREFSAIEPTTTDCALHKVRHFFRVRYQCLGNIFFTQDLVHGKNS